MGKGGNSDEFKKNPFRAVIAGGITGGIEICITYPTEFVKTKMQLYKELQKLGIFGCVKDTVSKYGVFGLYKGLSALLTFSIPKTAVRFGTNESLKNHVFTTPGRTTSFFAGLGAGIAEAILVVTPAETIKVKLIHDKLLEQPKYRGLIHGIMEITKAQGLGGIYRGVVPTILRQGSNQGIRFLVYDDVSKILKKEGLSEVPSNFLAGAVAGAASVLANTPVDVIKTVMQGLDASKYNGAWDCAQKIVEKEGVLGLYKGMVPRLGRVVLDVAITFTLYSQITRVINKVWPPSE